MYEFERCENISGSRDAIWGVLSRVTRWPVWLSTVHDVQALGSERLAIGARFRIAQPGLPAAVWTVSHLDPPHRFAWRMQRLGVSVEADHIVTPDGHDDCRLLLRIVVSGALGWLVAALGRSLIDQYLAREAAALQTIVTDYLESVGERRPSVPELIEWRRGTIGDLR